MSNPFDQFATELNAALPPGAAPAPSEDSNPFSFAPPTPAPAPSDKPVMNSPPPMPMNNGYGGGYGGQAPAMGQQQPPMYGGMAPQQPPMYGGMGSMNGGMGGPPPPQQNGMGGMPPMGMGMGMGGPQPPAPVPAAPSAGGDPFSSFGAPPPAPEQASNPYGAPPAAPGPSDMYSSFGAPPPGPDAYGAPQQAPPTPNPYGGPPGPPPQQAPPSAPPTPNPYGAPSDPYASSYGAPPPSGDPYGAPTQQMQQLQLQAPPTPSTYGAPQPPQQGPPPTQGQYGAPPPSSDPFGGYGAPPPAGPPANDPFGGYGAPPPGQQSPYGAPAPQPGYGDPFGADAGALVVSQQQSNPYGMPQEQAYAPAPAAVDPFSVFNQAPAPAAPPAPSDALVPAQQQQQQYPGAPPPPSNEGDLWGDLGFDPPPSAQSVAPSEYDAPEEEKKDSGDLPPGGEFYDARIFTPTLGVMFFKPQELTDSLFLNTERDLVDGLGERPVVAFIVEGSSARSAGVELGHVLLKVNGVDVKNPKEASRLIKEGPRPLPLLFYVPSTDVVVAEGEHMVKYDTRETTAPNSAKDWKPKYVVIGGIIAQPWMMNMYRSKSEYDIAVIETQARRPVSVKVKQFSLQGARVQNDWQGPQMVKYKNKLHPWKYIVVLPVARNPIKISSPNLASLKPVHEGIRRVLLSQQRGRGGNANTAAPVRESHTSSSRQVVAAAPSDHYHGAPPPQHQQHHAPPPQHHHHQQQQYHHQPPPQQQYAQPAYSGY